MKHRLGAAALASTILIGSMLVASPVNTTLEVTAFDGSSHVATGNALIGGWVSEQVKHSSSTQHGVIPNPFDVPPGPCRGIAVEWNVAVFLNRPTSTFEKLISKSANASCRLGITQGGQAGADGSFDLITAAPSK